MFFWVSYVVLYNLNQYGEGEMPTHALHCDARPGLPALPYGCIPSLTRRPVRRPAARLRHRALAPVCSMLGRKGYRPFRGNAPRHTGTASEDAVLQRMNSHVGSRALEGEGSVSSEPRCAQSVARL